MGLEIERRFLLKNNQWKNFITHKTSIEQGYLSYNLEDWIIRIRFEDNNYNTNFTNINNEKTKEIYVSDEEFSKHKEMLKKIKNPIWNKFNYQYLKK